LLPAAATPALPRADEARGGAAAAQTVASRE